jgi:AcrR family transcriptional regulator
MSLSFDSRIRAKSNRAKDEGSVERILKATEILLQERGHEALTTTVIANAAGVNIATLYKYFPNKSSILVAIIKQNREIWLKAADRSVGSVLDGADWRVTMEQVLEFAARRRKDMPGGHALRLAVLTLPDLQSFDREESLETAAFLSDFLTARGGLNPTRAMQVARVAVDIGNSVLDLALFNPSEDPAIWIAEAKSAVCQYLTPHLERKDAL